VTSPEQSSSNHVVSQENRCLGVTEGKITGQATAVARDAGNVALFTSAMSSREEFGDVYDQ